MKILILDDHPLILNAISNEIQQFKLNCKIHILCTVEQSVELIKTDKIDFVVCDLQIVSGKSLIIPKLCFDLGIPYMVYSSHSNKVLFNSLLEIGLSVYVSKSSSSEELRSGLIALFNGEKYFCSILNSVIHTDDKLKNISPLNASKTQLKILELLGQGHTQTEVAEKLKISFRTVVNHLAILRNNNNCMSTQELVLRYKFWN